MNTVTKRPGVLRTIGRIILWVVVAETIRRIIRFALR